MLWLLLLLLLLLLLWLMPLSRLPPPLICKVGDNDRRLRGECERRCWRGGGLLLREPACERDRDLLGEVALGAACCCVKSKLGQMALIAALPSSTLAFALLRFLAAFSCLARAALTDLKAPPRGLFSQPSCEAVSDTTN